MTFRLSCKVPARVHRHSSLRQLPLPASHHLLVCASEVHRAALRTAAQQAHHRPAIIAP
jgi:hypothetical protein